VIKKEVKKRLSELISGLVQGGDMRSARFEFAIAISPFWQTTLCCFFVRSLKPDTTAVLVQVV